MTTAQKVIVGVLLTGAIAAGVYEGIQASRYRERLTALEQQQAAADEKAKQFDSVKRERDDATKRLAQVMDENDSLKKRPVDTLKLRNEVGQLKRENQEIGSKSPLSKVTASPEARSMLRDQQKMGMGMLYKTFSDQAKLSPELKEKFNDLLADHVMGNVDTITTMLRDKPAKDQMDAAFAAQSAALQKDVSEMLGPDALAQFNDYNKNLAANLTAQQFKDQMTGTDAEKDAKAQQLTSVMQAAVTAALASANLPADFQVVPILNFENIASEQQGDASIKMLESIYQKVMAQSGSFLSPDELEKFQKYTATAISNSRMGLTLNRSMMAPIAQ